MKKVLIRSILTAFSIEAVGAIVNLISYFLCREFLLAQTVYGGEWRGWRGFGMMLNRVYPMHPVSESYKFPTWISFDDYSLQVTLAAGFVLGFIVFYTIYAIKKRTRK